MSPRNKENSGHQQNIKAGHWLAADLRIPRADLGFPPPHIHNHPAESNLCPAPTPLIPPQESAWLPGDVASQGLDKLGHTQAAGLPKGRVRAWPYRSEPGKRKGREGRKSVEVATNSSWILGWQLDHRPGAIRD